MTAPLASAIDRAERCIAAEPSGPYAYNLLAALRGLHRVAAMRDVQTQWELWEDWYGAGFDSECASVERHMLQVAA